MLSGVLKLIANRLLLPRLLPKRARSQAPFLHRSYPASSVVRACPTPDIAATQVVTFGVATPRAIGPPPMCRVALSTCRAHYPGGSERVHMSGFLPRSMQPSPLHRRVGIRIATF